MPPRLADSSCVIAVRVYALPVQFVTPRQSVPGHRQDALVVGGVCSVLWPVGWCLALRAWELPGLVSLPDLRFCPWS